MKTTAAVLVETGKPLELVELDVPKLAAGQVLVAISYSGVCGSQLLEVTGGRGPDKWLPHCLGHEGTGVVLEAAPDVTRVAVGDWVSLSWIACSGLPWAAPAVYDWNGRQVNAGPVTTLQRHAVVSQDRLTRMQKHISMDVGILLGCAAPTGFGAVANVAHLKRGETVAVWGCGGVGVMAIAMAEFVGASRIIAIDPVHYRRELAASMGATEGCPPDEARKVASGVAAAIVTTGSRDAMIDALACVRPRGGRVVVVGNAPAGKMLTVDPHEFNLGKSVLGTWGGNSDPDQDGALYAAMIASDPIRYRRCMSTPYALEQVNVALDDLAAGRVGRPLVDMAMREDVRWWNATLSGSSAHTPGQSETT